MARFDVVFPDLVFENENPNVCLEDTLLKGVLIVPIFSHAEQLFIDAARAFPVSTNYHI